MSSKQVLLLGLCLVLPFIGIERTIYCLFICITLIFGFVFLIIKIFHSSSILFSFLLHLIINKQLWHRTSAIYDRIRTSFIASKLISHVREILLQRFDDDEFEYLDQCNSIRFISIKIFQ